MDVIVMFNVDCADSVVNEVRILRTRVVDISYASINIIHRMRSRIENSVQ
jgi:hypothetical protein